VFFHPPKSCSTVVLVLLRMAPLAYFRGRTRHAVDLESLCFSLYKCTRFDIIAVLYTCTTVASRVAANACATHLRFLTKPQTPSCLASSSLLGQRRAPFKKKSLRRNCLVNNFLLVLIIFRVRRYSGPKANSAFFVPSPKAQVTFRVGQRPLDEVSQFRPNRSGFTPDQTPSFPRSRHPRPSNLWKHGEHTEVNSHKQFPQTWGLKPTNKQKHTS